MRKLLIAGALAFASLAVPAQAVEIVPVAASASSQFSGFGVEFAIDQGPGSDTSDWSSQSQGSSATLDLDLGAVYSLASAIVTDRVTSGGGNFDFHGGVTDFTTKFGLQAFTDDTFTTTLSSVLVFDHMTPVNPTTPSDFRFTAALNGLTARYIRYSVLANNQGNNNTGLSDIRFLTAVPEPATWALMIFGFGAAGTVLRRRLRGHGQGAFA